MNRDRSYLARQQEFYEEMAREPGFLGSYWEKQKRENEALIEALELEDAFVEGKNCTTQKQRRAARQEYKRNQRILANQRKAEQILKV